MIESAGVELEVSSSPKPAVISTTGKVLIGITGSLAVSLTVLCGPFVSPALRRYCLPYIPATSTQVSNILVALRNKKGTLLDIGSGDGRIVFEAAKNNFISHGVELNVWLVLYCRISAYFKGLNRQTKFFRKDLWKFDLSKYDNLVIFGVEQMMPELERKFLRECKRDCSIVVCRFPLPNLKLVKTVGEGVDTVWVYENHRV